MQGETLRALSYFKGNSTASEAIINALQGRFLTGGYKDEDHLPVREALYALGALGDPNSRDVLEYWANYAQDETAKTYAKKVLKYFGKASYDEIEKA